MATRTRAAHADTPIGADDRLTIAAVSELLDIPIPTIRSWERRYGFPMPARTGGRHRRYGPAEAEQLRRVRDEVARGHPTHEAVRLVRDAATAEGPAAVLLRRFVDEAMRLDPDGLRAALHDAAEAIGVDPAIRDIVLPGMREMGDRWRAGVCDTAHEHLATESVRVWLARQSALAPPAFRAAPIVLACGPKDLHTIGLEAFGVILARRGWPLRVLGSLTPVDSLMTAVRVARAEAAVVTSQRSATRRPAVAALTAVDAMPGVRVFYAGMAFAPEAARRDVPGTWLGDDVLEAADLLERALAPRRRTRSSATQA
jgi:DNA-binding transcriptional MerR regulator